MAALCWLAIAGAAFAQRPEFEVASVKHSSFNGQFGSVRRSGTLVTIHSTQVGVLIFYAYNLKGAYEVVGIPNWPDEARWFDVDARTPPDATEDQVRLMFQSLLADRFKMKTHRETKQVTEYSLTLGKGKLKLTPSSGDGPLTINMQGKPYTQPYGTCGTSLGIEGARGVCRAAAMGRIAAAVGAEMRSPVTDRTGLTGSYDLDLLYWPDDRTVQPDDIFTPKIAQALGDLGLKLEKTSGAVEVLVIDHIEQPSEN